MQPRLSSEKRPCHEGSDKVTATHKLRHCVVINPWCMTESGGQAWHCDLDRVELDACERDFGIITDKAGLALEEVAIELDDTTEQPIHAAVRMVGHKLVLRGQRLANRKTELSRHGLSTVRRTVPQGGGAHVRLTWKTESTRLFFVSAARFVGACAAKKVRTSMNSAALRPYAGSIGILSANSWYSWHLPPNQSTWHQLLARTKSMQQVQQRRSNLRTDAGWRTCLRQRNDATGCG